MKTKGKYIVKFYHWCKILESSWQISADGFQQSKSPLFKYPILERQIVPGCFVRRKEIFWTDSTDPFWTTMIKHYRRVNTPLERKLRQN
jgi:hypothetical protein